MLVKNSLRSRFILSCFFASFCVCKAQQVNKFTGNLNHNVPLVTLPSREGPTVSVNAGYSSGVGTNQTASELGLGWGLSAGGAITRTVSGIPDDWKSSNLPNPGNGTYQSFTGTMYMGAGSGTYNDFYQSRWRNPLDSVYFNFPDYDAYTVSGPGISGTLEPHLFDYPTLNVTDGTVQLGDTRFRKKMQFILGGDFKDTIVSRYYQNTPIDNTTVLKLPQDQVSYAYDTPYPFTPATNNLPFIGRRNEGYDTVGATNRLASAGYVEYFTNNDINTGVSGFIDYKTSHSRTIDLYGIGAYRITDASGYTFHYSQPVYVNHVVVGNYPLNNDYTIETAGYDYTKTGGGDGNSYVITDPNHNNMVVEYKQDKKYAYSWLLTAVTGPDYVDSNSDGMADAGDKGYWMSYDYELWTNNFNKRSPEAGFQYSYNCQEGDITQEMNLNGTGKISGMYGSWTRYNQELYYLNSIKSSTHTAVFVRDIREDNCSTPEYYDDEFRKSVDMSVSNNNTTLASWGGTLKSEGFPALYTTNDNLVITIAPPGVDKLTVSFSQFNVGDGAYNDHDYLYVYDCNCTSSGNLVATLNSFGQSSGWVPSSITSSGNALTFKFVSDGNNVGGVGMLDAGFVLNWTPVWTTTNPKRTPQLKLSKVVLFKNEDLATLPAISAFGSYSALWDMAKTTNSSPVIYSGNWYTANHTAIENVSLHSVEFNQDYSLAKNYYSNANMNFPTTFKDSPPTTVATNKTTNAFANSTTGKLTLNEIVTYELNHTKTQPSVLFDYNASSGTYNPDFDPKAVDNWGFYKSDISTNGYSSYTTATSAPYTSAWSLNKITTPAGGTVEIAYEGNRYGSTFAEAGGFKGPSRRYLISNATPPTTGSPILGADWNLTMEDYVSDFTDFLGIQPASTIRKVYVPFNLGAGVSGGDGSRAWGTGTLTSSPLRITGLDSVYSSLSFNYFSLDAFSNFVGATLAYSGNGYINFDLGIGNEVYGGGPRVQSITNRNGTSDAYVTSYSYAGGVATSEPDRFAAPKRRGPGLKTLMKLRGFDNDHHRMAPQIGYTKVVVKNLGEIGTANGSSVYTFATSDAGYDNYSLRTQKRLTQAWDYTGSPSDFSTWGLMDTSYIVEVVDRFNALWGQNTMVQVADAMGDTISKTVNTFASTTQGAIVENYNFEQRYTHWGCNPGSHCSVTLHHNTVCILRKYPVVMTQQTSYSKGASVLTENLKFDEVSGQTTLSRVTSPNKGVNVNKTVPAFRVSNYSSMGPKSVNSSNTNMVSANSASRVTVDSTITASSDFGAYHIGVFGSTFNQRQYVSGSTDFENVSVTLPYEKGIKSYVWAGNQASLDNYGLYKTSDFVAFDYTLAAIDPKWRFSQEQTLFDPIGHALETKGYNNRYNAVKFGYRNQYPIAQAGNSNFASFTYSGFEDQYDVSPPSHVYYTGGEVKMNGGLQILSAGSGAITPHTGDSLVQVSAGATGPSFSVKYLGTSAENVGLQKDRIYRASVWIHSASPADATVSLTYAGGTPVTMRRDDAKGIVIGNWIQLNVDITVPYTAATNDLLVVSLNPGSGSTSYFDDMRLQSTDAVVTSSVYDHKTGWLTATLDANNFATKYVRDAGGKVFEVWQEIQGSGFKKVKKYSYNYGRGL